MPEQSPDPDLSSLVEDIGRGVNDLIAKYLSDQRTRRITDPAKVEDLRALFDEPLPSRGTPYQQVLDLFASRVAPHTTVSTSPGYFGLMNPTPVPIAIFADALASTLNQNQAAASHSPVGSVVEETVIRWLGEATGYGSDCDGHLTSGGTVANLTGLKLAMHRIAPEVRDIGLAQAGRRLAVYISDQAHFSFVRAVDVLGLGRDALRSVPARQDATADVEAFKAAIESDRRQGWEPMAVVGNAGTTAAGAIDPLEELSVLAGEIGAWFHVDAAYGGAAGLSREYPGLLHGIELADSVTVDAHKWFFVPFVAGGILHRDPGHGLDTFRATAGYIPPSVASSGRPPTDYYQHGLAGTRRFNALKVWMALKHMGADWYSDTVDRQLRLAREFADKIESLSDWSIAIAPVTAIVTFRYEPSQIAEAIRRGETEADSARRKRDVLQQKIARTVQEEGRFWISAAPLPGGIALRLNVISYLTDESTLDAFLESLPGLEKSVK